MTVVAQRLKHVAAATAAAVVAVVLQPLPALAVAPDSPAIISPDGTSGPAVEVSWTGVDRATAYEVRIDDDPSFGSPEWSVLTPNTVAVPNRFFAPGTQNVSVRARNSANEWSGWASSTFAVTPPAGPELTFPAAGAVLTNPDEPPLLTWTPVPGAVSYTVEIDTEDQFIGATTYSTKATSYVVADNQAPGVDYFWRVQAVLANGVASDRSSTRIYSVEPIATPALTGPAYDEDVTDVVLDWDPVPGAKHYELQVDDDVNFGSPDASVPSKIFGTRFSPGTTFANGQYYWRVRARDLDDNPTEWIHLTADAHYFFDRLWRDQPQLVYPYDTSGAVQYVSNDLYFEWKPVRHASNYEVWLSTDPNFTEPTNATVQCEVAGTTYTPGEHGDQCMPSAEGDVYYWKVRPMDRPYAGGGVQGIFSEKQSFVYTDQDAVSITSPAEGSKAAVPTLDWSPVPSTETYELQLYQNGALRQKASTHSTSYTPLGLRLDPVNGTSLTWKIRALDKDGRTSRWISRDFTWDPSLVDTLTPLELASGPATYDAPNLRWGAVSGASYYRLDIANVLTGVPYSDSVAPVLSQQLYFPAATDTQLTFLDEGTYRWWVTAYDSQDEPIGSTPTDGFGTFEVLPLGPVTGQRLALTGSALDSGDACTETLVDGATHLCAGVPATPVLDWEPVPYASEYRVRVARDPDFTDSELDPTAPHTVNTRWTPRASYPYFALEESQANKAYYWFIQPCKSEAQCGPDPKSTVNPSMHAFRKTSPAARLQAPADGAVIDDTEVTFTWEDYYLTNQASTYDATGEPGYQSAQQYRIQVSTQPTFATLVDSQVVDQVTYTAVSRLYPDGPLYWRVQAIDANNNALAWSTPRVLEKKSPQPVLTAPVEQAGVAPEVSGAVRLTWKAQPFAGSYEVQVAANDDLNFSSTNLEVSKTSKRPAFTTGGAGTDLLAPSETPYVWRVRRKDPYGNVGPWSAAGRFKVVLDKPDLLTPSAGAVVGPRGLVLRWAPVAAAATYKVELRRLNSSITTILTPATAYAPTTVLAVEGVYEWRVTSVDASRHTGLAGAWRTFTIGGAPQATTAASISGTAVLGTALTAVDPTWNVPGVVDTYEWRRNGVAIPGATADTHTVGVDDVGQQITVVVTGTSSEFGTGVSTSAPVTGKPGAGPVALSAPVISGTGQVGSQLAAALPQWDPAETVVSLQWKRNGTSISGATQATYLVTSSDLNTTLTLVATGTLPGRTPTESVSNAISATQGPAAVATVAPTITGTPTVGLRLTSTAPTWNVPNVQNTIVWLRDGVPIDLATASTYVVQSADVGNAISVRYTGRVPGRADGVTESAAVTAQPGDATTTPPPASTSAPTGTTTTTGTTTPAPTSPVASTTRLKAPKKATAGKKTAVKVIVKADGITSPTGVVKIFAGKKLLAKVRLKAGAKGIAKTRLAALKKGRYKLRVVYAGATGVAGSSAKRKLLVV